jgi:hypothetical protein
MKNTHGIPMTPEELEEHLKAFSDIEESIALVMGSSDEIKEPTPIKKSAMLF